MKARAAILVLLIGTGTANAGINDYVGAWSLSLHGKHCAIRLTETKFKQGYVLAQKCPDTFGVQSAVAWKPFDGGIVFLSETGAPVTTFEATEEIYVSASNPDLALRGGPLKCGRHCRI